MIAVFITNHGFGHLNRTVNVLNRIPNHVAISIFCHESLFDHWRERLSRGAEMFSHVCDAGAVNPPGDSATTDGPGTIRRAMEIDAAATAELPSTVQRLRDLRVGVILSDAATKPMLYAREIGVPGYLLANFTWAEIYRPHADRLGEAERSFVAGLRAETRAATAILRAEPALAMNRVGTNVIDVGIVAGRSESRREELRRELGIGRSETLVYCYFGRYGNTDLGWHNIERLGADGYRFVGFHRAPGRAIENLHVVDARRWTGADLAASCHVMVTKAGYGTVAEAMVARRPIIYPPRTGFAEHRALDRSMARWGGGIRASSRDFNEFRLAKHLERARSLEVAEPPFPIDGADRVARLLMEAVG